jgi:murein DD-endopeptidase MepM/ murein hydrolase activator NlpD
MFSIQLVIHAVPAFAQYPVIREFSLKNDSHFYEQQKDISLFYKNQTKPVLIPALIIFEYGLRDKDDLFRLAASVNLSYDTLTTLNGWDNPDSFPRNGGKVLIPNLPGLFIPVKANNDFEMVLQETDRKLLSPTRIFIKNNGTVREFLFYPGSKFTSEERKIFLGGLFLIPVTEIHITSRFGYRMHPVYGHWSFHHGIDFESNSGSPVYPARNGTVKETGFNETYGNYLILTHDNGYETLYGHLQKVYKKEGETVTRQDIIGSTGNTGISSGPHLHFEIIKDGNPVNPELYLRGIDNEQ